MSPAAAARRRVDAVAVTEIYASVQGESTHAGRLCTFVRLAGCPLRCRWCDTTYSFTAGARMPLADICNEVKRLGLPLVELTGGEPLAQAGAAPLVGLLCELGYEVLIETSGAYPVADLDPRAVVIADLKCPGSGEHARNRWDVLAGLRPRDELKIVVADRADFDWACQRLRDELADCPATVLWSAVHGELDGASLAAWLLELRPRGRLQVQLHKVLWPAAARGV